MEEKKYWNIILKNKMKGSHEKRCLWNKLSRSSFLK